jgi:hypothetical protein
VLGTLALLIYFVVLIIKQLRDEQSVAGKPSFPPAAKRCGRWNAQYR